MRACCAYPYRTYSLDVSWRHHMTWSWRYRIPLYSHDPSETVIWVCMRNNEMIVCVCVSYARHLDWPILDSPSCDWDSLYFDTVVGLGRVLSPLSLRDFNLMRESLFWATSFYWNSSCLYWLDRRSKELPRYWIKDAFTMVAVVVVRWWFDSRPFNWLEHLLALLRIGDVSFWCHCSKGRKVLIRSSSFLSWRDCVAL